MANDVIFDPILGKLREQDVSGGTGGGTYEAGPGIDAAALEDGTIAVTGLTAAVSGSTATITPKGSTVGVKLVGRDGVLVQGNTNSEVEFDVPAVSKHAVFSNSAASLAANTELVAVDHCANMKNDYAVFFANFETFDTLKISHMAFGRGRYFIVDATTIKVYNNDGTMWQNFSHGLTLSSFIYVVVSKKNTSDAVSDITIMTEGGSYTAHSTLYYANAGPLTAVATAAMANVEFNFVVTDAQCPVWVFGDSYIEFGNMSWAYQFCKAGHTGVSFNGYGGRGSNVAVLSFNNLISKAIPRYVVWAIGMNDPDSSTAINASWKTVADYLIEKCSELGITLIFCTIPNVPNPSYGNNEYKNAYIKSSGHRYIDFAHAVNADSAGATWYPGMLSSDNVHPTALGGEALMHQFIQDCPESVLLDENTLPMAGFHTEINAGLTISQAAWWPVETTPPSPFLRVYPGSSYKLIPQPQSSTVGLIAMNNIPGGQYGMESHVQVFVPTSNFISPGSNVILADEPKVGKVNNLLVRFRDQQVVVTLEDNVPPYVVTVSSGTTFGTIYYGLASSTEKYLGFNGDELTADLGGATVTDGKYIIGNGQDKSFISGNISCTSSLELWNLGIRDVTLYGGTVSFVNAFITSGGTLTNSGAVLDFRELNGDGGTLNMNGSNYNAKTVHISGCTITGGTAAVGGAFSFTGTASGFFESCTISGNMATATAGGINGPCTLISCIVTGNTSSNGGGLFTTNATLSGCIISGNENSDIRFTDSKTIISAADCILGKCYTSRGKMYLEGSNHIGLMAGASATIYIAEGAIVDMTGVATATVVNPGSGIVVSGTGCTVINSGGTSVSITGGTYATIKNDGTTT